MRMIASSSATRTRVRSGSRMEVVLQDVRLLVQRLDESVADDAFDPATDDRNLDAHVEPGDASAAVARRAELLRSTRLESRLEGLRHDRDPPRQRARVEVADLVPRDDVPADGADH